MTTDNISEKSNRKDTSDKNLLPEKIEPRQLALQNIHMSGALLITEETMPSLTKQIVIAQHSSGEEEGANTVDVELVFDQDLDQQLFVEGKIKTDLTLICQNCEKPLTHNIDSEFKLAIVSTVEEAKELPEYYEPLLLSDGHALLNQIIEEELLLCLPLIPRHNEEIPCFELPESKENTQLEKRENPFNVLKSLKKPSNK